MDLKTFKVDRSQIEIQTAANLVSSGDIPAEDYLKAVEILKEMELKDLIISLVESHQARENAANEVPFFPVDPRSFCQN